MEHHNIPYHNVSRETFKEVNKTYLNHQKDLEAYLDRLLWWNKRINLVSRDVPRETIRYHLIHSLLISHLDIFKSSNTIVDAGTGGGLPGMPLAITYPEKDFLLNDIVSKKCLAIKQMSRKLGLQNVQVADSSVEKIDQKDPFLLISKHAFKINDLYHMTAHLPWESIVFYKGIDFKHELKGIKPSVSVRCYDLSLGGEFYEGKALIRVQRN